MTYIEDADFFVRLISLPTGVNGLVSPNPDGTFNLYLNAEIDHEKQLDAYFHEVSHIEEDDFYNGIDIRKVEGL